MPDQSPPPPNQLPPSPTNPSPEVNQPSEPTSPDQPLSPADQFLQKHRAFVLAVFIIFSLFALGTLSFFMYSWSANQPQDLSVTAQSIPETKTPKQDLTTTQGPTPTAKPSPTPIPQVIASDQAQITQMQPIATFKNDEDELELFSIGTITDTKYAGQQIYLGMFKYYPGPCKGPRCSDPIMIRFIGEPNQLTLLTQISHLYMAPEAQGPPRLKQLLELYDWQLQTNDLVVIEDLLPPQTIDNPNGSGYVSINGYGIGSSQSPVLVKAFTHRFYGDIFTTNSDYSPQEPFYNDGEEQPYETRQAFGSGTSTCRDEQCYFANGFYHFLPDGTYARYEYTPNMLEKNEERPWEVPKLLPEMVELSSGEKLTSQYGYQTKDGCGDSTSDYISVVSPKTISKDQLIEVGNITDSNQAVYFPPEDHQVFAHFHNKVMSSLDDWYFNSNDPKPAQDLTLDQFVTSRPIIYWEDPFGRLIRFTKVDYTVPFFCEPIIYLYPETTQEITVSLPETISNLYTEPAYTSSWQVTAQPDGTITAPDNSTHPYLFWEGSLGYWPRLETGYVLAAADIPDFLTTKLPAMGLNQKETQDFIDAWLSDLQQAPYYALSFYPQYLVDEKIPLDIHPTPDTIIRILMDYQPLAEPVQIAQPQLPPPPPRTGFTVVEWGGLKR